MNPRRMTPNQMRYLCSRSELETYVAKRLSSLNKRSIDAWNARNESSSRASVNLSNITHETLVYIASALNKAERIGSSVKTNSDSDSSSDSENL
jgi:hypothetical protein